MSLEAQTLEVRECKKPGCVMSAQGEIIPVPLGWKLLPPGDATATRRVKACGPHWVMLKRVRNKWISLGIWADGAKIDRIAAEVKNEKSDPAYTRKLESARRRRELEQQTYEGEFRDGMHQFLRFHPRFREFEDRMVDLVTAHAIPVGSGTVARTTRIPLESRVRAAVVAWMRHQTTAYDYLSIPLVKGARREVRRDLAKESLNLLEQYRSGEVNLDRCPLAIALRAATEKTCQS